MKSLIIKLAVVLLIICSAVSMTLADTPPANTIPVIGLKPAYEGIDTEFFSFLSWHFFDGLSRQGYSMADILNNVVLPGDTTGMLTIVNPWLITCETTWYANMYGEVAGKPFVRPGWNNYVINDSVSCDKDTIIDSRTITEMEDRMELVADSLNASFNQNSHSVWFYYSYDEAPAFQYSRMIRDSVAGVYSEFDDYMPNLYTQEMDSVYRPDLDSTLKWQPTLAEVDSRGVLSWMNWYIQQADSTRELGYIISCMHTLKNWAYATNIELGYNDIPPNFDNQAQAVEALLDMEYQEYDVHSTAEANYPSFLALDAYPFRLVGTDYQTDSSYTQQLGDSLEHWLVDHYEEAMDSTFIPTWRVTLEDTSRHVSMFFVPQAFGKAGGTAMWSSDSTALQYDSYGYRIPTPQDFRMTCNSALIRQAKAILPFCFVTYVSTSSVDTIYTVIAGLLDENNIPFDAPYEEWVYTDRLRSDIDYIPPDSIAPFISGFDPLYSQPSRPVDVQGSQRNTENYLLWKFAAYARLWNSAKRTLGDIARVAPELARLNWWEDYVDYVEIEYDGTEPSMFITPQAKVFTDSTESYAYIYYLNRFCRANDNPFEITIDAGDFPSGTPFSEYALDHSRRFLVEGDEIARDEYSFLDTLDAGEGRLLEMISSSSINYGDLRITDPDITVIRAADDDTLSDYRGTPGETVDICAMFYNMGTSSLTEVEVYLYDDTDSIMLDTQYVSFDGLDTDSCYKCDRDDAIFSWTPRSTDLGVHRLRVYTESIFLEHDSTDNTARLVYIVDPADYATEELDDPWDMTEATSNPPTWHTKDIKSMTGWNSSLFTDSVSGMFEGTIPDPSTGSTMEMNLGTSSSTWIDTDIYHNLCLTGIAETSLNIEIHWIDGDDDTSYIDTGEDFTATWQEIGPVDLSGVAWDGLRIKKLWFEFSSGSHSSATDVRIGWIKLTE